MTEQFPKHEDKRRIHTVCPSCEYYAGMLTRNCYAAGFASLPGEEVTSYLCRHPKRITSTLESCIRIDAAVLRCPLYAADARYKDDRNHLIEENDALRERITYLADSLTKCQDELLKDKTPQEEQPAAPENRRIEDLGFADL